MTKTISLQDEIWNEIKSQKRPGQSYSGFFVEELNLDIEIK